MYSPDKITIIGLPSKQVMKEIPVQVGLADVEGFSLRLNWDFIKIY